ncbi:MAG: MBL fold metallo-hydrolase [Pseudomonadota bacterium]
MTISNDCVVLIGTKGGPAIRPGSPMPSSNLLRLGGRTCVIDCGLGVTSGLVATGFELKDLETIFISHLHSDHYLELGPLIHTAWTAGLKTPLMVYGPPGLDAYISAFLQSMKADIDLRIEDEGRTDLARLIGFTPIVEGPVIEDKNFRVEAARNHHPPLEDTFALKFETDAKRVIFSGDTAPIDAMIDFAQGADLLVHEAMLTNGVEALAKRVGNGDDRLVRHLMASHSPAEEVGRLASKAGVRHLAVNHLIPCDDPDFTDPDWETAIRSTWSGRLTIGKDGLHIPV